jgi:hypothetical protein
MIHELLEHFVPGQWECTAPGLMTITDSGLGFLYGGEVSLIMGFGVLSSLSPSHDLLATIDRWNRLTHVTHAWLAEGADNDHWSLMLGLKLPYMWMTEDTCRQAMYTALTNQASLTALALNEQNFGAFGGAPYLPEDLGRPSRAFIMMGHLG